MRAFNDLTPAEAERLDFIQEECSEVIKAVAKIKRHGFNSWNPDDPNHEGNRRELVKEIQDVIKAVGLLVLSGDIALDDSPSDKQARLKFMHEQSIDNVHWSYIHFFEKVNEDGWEQKVEDYTNAKR